MEGTVYINGRELGNINEIEIKNRSLDDKLKPVNLGGEFNCAISNIKFINHYKIRRLLSISRKTNKIRTKKKLLNRAYKLSKGIPLLFYK